MTWLVVIGALCLVTAFIDERRRRRFADRPIAMVPSPWQLRQWRKERDRA